MSSQRLERVEIQTLIVTSAASLPTGSIGDADIEEGADVDSGKLGQEPAINYAQAPGSDIATATEDLTISNVIGTIDTFQAAVTGTAATGDRSATVKIQKSTGGAAFADATSTITLDSSATIRVKQDGTITSASLAAGDILRVVVTQVVGSTGTRPQGLIVTLILKKAANP